MDEEPGNRVSDCGGIMEPIAVWVRKNGEWAIIHHCRRCGRLNLNRIAADDNPMKLMSIAMKPLCEPPFPIERTALMGAAEAFRIEKQVSFWSSMPIKRLMLFFSYIIIHI